MTTDELVAIDLPPGPRWLELVRQLWVEQIPFLPLDHRLTDAEKRSILERARPTTIRDVEGETVLADGAPVGPGVSVVVATSGVGGAPKLVELHRVAVAVAVRTSAKRLGATPGAPWLAVLSPAHVGGLLVLLRGAVLGAPVVVHDRFDPVRLVEDGEGAAFVSVVPTMVRRLLEAGLGLHGLTLLVGGDALDPADAGAARSRGARVVTTYGLTETCGGFAYDGVPLDGTSVRLDPEGRLEVTGPTLMEGYRLDGGATGAAFTTDGWLRTGDLATLDDDGRIEVLGRADDVIRTGAEKVWPQEIERALADHPAVADVAAAAAPDDEWGQRVVVYVVPASLDRPPSLDDLRAHAADRLARFKLPRELRLVPSIARTGSGKVRRTELR
jgi:O-succinylbenzoic acid--CoA ligase